MHDVGQLRATSGRSGRFRSDARGFAQLRAMWSNPLDVAHLRAMSSKSAGLRADARAS
jgi:hypothetical protein